MNTTRLSLTCLATIACASLTVNASWQGAPSSQPTAELLAMGLQGASGSTVGPDGALYVTEGALGRVSRVDPKDRRHHDVRQRAPNRNRPHWWSD